MQCRLNFKICCSYFMNLFSSVLQNLKISTSTRKGYSSGTLMNLVSVDVERIEEFSFHCSGLISSPIKIMVIIFIMWQYIGPSCLAGVAVMAFLIPVCLYASRLNEKFSVRYGIQFLKKFYINLFCCI